MSLKIGRLSAVLCAALTSACLGTPAAAGTTLTGVTGPYTVVMEMDPGLPGHTVYRPKNLERVTGKLPVVAFGNGACGNEGNVFAPFLSEIASFGYVVVADGPIVPGAMRAAQQLWAAMRSAADHPGQPVGGPGSNGPPLPKFPRVQPSTTTELIETLRWAQSQGKAQSGRYADKLDPAELAVMGQSCGGLQALAAASDPSVKTAVILNSGIIRGRLRLPHNLPPPPGLPPPDLTNLPATVQSLKSLHAPTLYLIGGSADIAYDNAHEDFKEITGVPVFLASMPSVGHMATYWQPHGGEFAAVVVRWLDWQLKDDDKAAALFTGERCGLCKSPLWRVQRKNWHWREGLK